MAACLEPCLKGVVLFGSDGVLVPIVKGNIPVSVRCSQRVELLSDTTPLVADENRLSAVSLYTQFPSFDVCLFLDETGGPDGGDSNVDFIIEAAIGLIGPFFEVFRVNLPTTAALPTAVFVERFKATCKHYRFRLFNKTATAYGVTQFAVLQNPNT